MTLWPTPHAGRKTVIWRRIIKFIIQKQARATNFWLGNPTRVTVANGTQIPGQLPQIRISAFTNSNRSSQIHSPTQLESCQNLESGVQQLV